MRIAHQRSWQSCLATAVVVAASGCATQPLPDSMWPPENFEVRVEQVRLENGSPRIVRRFRALADGLVSVATSSSSLVDPVTQTQLPVFERMCSYQLVPTSIRALARRIERCGIADMDTRQGERGIAADTYLVLVWQAMDRIRSVTAVGRVHGAMADILSIVMAHMPDGEGFDLPGLMDRPVVPVLRGVPAPCDGAEGALRAHVALLERRPHDRILMEDAFALACRLDRQAEARALLQQWMEATADERRLQEMFPADTPRLSPEVLRRLLPAEP